MAAPTRSSRGFGGGIQQSQVDFQKRFDAYASPRYDERLADLDGRIRSLRDELLSFPDSLAPHICSLIGEAIGPALELALESARHNVRAETTPVASPLPPSSAARSPRTDGWDDGRGSSGDDDIDWI